MKNPTRSSNHLGALGVALTALLAASPMALAGGPHNYDLESAQDSYDRGTDAAQAAHTKLKIKGYSFFDLGKALLVKLDIKGLSKFYNVKVILRATAEVEIECINPGGNKPPGAQPDPQVVEVTGIEIYSRHQIENGKLSVAIKTDNAEVDAGEFCPNPNWTANIKDVRFLDATVRVIQKAKHKTLLCTFVPPTKDGKIHSNHVECSEL